MSDIKIIDVRPDNLDQEHICCAFSDKKCARGYADKQQWLSNQHAHGYVFKRLDVRGKAFIEYVPASQAWLPVDAPNHMVINCFWVAGQYKGQGDGLRLLQECLDAAKGMHGVVAVTAEKKRPFMSDPKFLEKQGFECVDSAPPYFKLWCKTLKPNAVQPQFKPSAKLGRIAGSKGIVAFYSSTCPFTDHWTNRALRDYAKTKGIACQVHKIETREQALSMPIPWIINSVFFNGELVTVEMDSTKKLDEVLAGG